MLTATAAIAVLAVAALVLSSLRAQPATAHLFRIVYLDDEIHLEIVDLVEDPRAAERQLQDELGIDVELVALPAPPELVDRVVGAAGSGTTAAGFVRLLTHPSVLSRPAEPAGADTRRPPRPRVRRSTAPSAQAWARAPVRGGPRRSGCR